MPFLPTTFCLAKSSSIELNFPDVSWVILDGLFLLGSFLIANIRQKPMISWQEIKFEKILGHPYQGFKA